MTYTTWLSALAVAAALGSPASAAVLKFQSNGDAQIFNSNAPVDVDLNGEAAGVQSLAFSVTEPKIVVITFVAECSIAGDFQAWANIDILIKRPGDADYIRLAPTNSDNAFCSGGSNAQDNWVSATAVASVRAPAGASRVKVQVSNGFRSGDGTQNIRLDDIGVYVID